MKKKILMLLPAILLCSFSVYLFLAMFFGKGWDRSTLLIMIVCVVLVQYVYYAWLVMRGGLSKRMIVGYWPIVVLVSLACIGIIIFQPWLRRARFDMGPDPFDPTSTITSLVKFPIWSKEYWSNTARERYRQERLTQMQTTRQGSLIGHVGTDLRGWSVDRIRTAFGEPIRIDRSGDQTEQWIYRPWTNHPDWEMPVYVRDGYLLQIGD